jgi:hypothetical protein
MSELDEPFRRGELVTLRDALAEPLGRVLSVADGGDQAEVAWFKFPGHEHEVTVEAIVMLRRVHESEMEAEPE